MTVEQNIFGPVTITPALTDSVAQLDSNGTLALTGSQPVTCISQAGALGSESIVCSETNNKIDPIIREFVNVKSLDASSGSSRRRYLLSSGSIDQTPAFNGTEVIPIYRGLQPIPLTNADTFSCILSSVDLGSNPQHGVVLNYRQCRIGGNAITVTSEQILVGPGAVIAYGSGKLRRADLVLPSPGQDLLTTSFTLGCKTDTNITGYTNLFIQGNLVEQGCSITALGTSVNAILEIDFGYESDAACDDGFEVILEENFATIKRPDVEIQPDVIRPGVEMTIEYGSSFRDILIKMSNCNDFVNVTSTFLNSSSVEIWGGGGNDTITIGTTNTPFEASIYANIVVHGNSGDSDTLFIADPSTQNKAEVLRPMKLTGLHARDGNSNATKSVEFDGFEFLNIALSNGENDLTIVSTATGSVTRIDSGNQNDTVFVENTGGTLFINTFGGEDMVLVENTGGELFIDTFGGDDVVLVENTSGPLYVNTLGGEDTVTVLNAQGDFQIDCGAGNDVVFVYGLASGHTGTIYGGDGNDTLTLDGRGTPEARNTAPDVLVNTFDGATIRWSGGENDDTLNTFFTSTKNSNVDIFDDLDGNFLNVECADFACYVLSRENFLANIHDMKNPNSTAERINIDRKKNATGGFVATARISSVLLNLNG